jgi:hypothetical protein
MQAQAVTIVSGLKVGHRFGRIDIALVASELSK